MPVHLYPPGDGGGDLMLEGAKIQLLLVEDEEYDVRRVMKTLQPLQDRIIVRDVVADGREAIELLRLNPALYDIVIMDFQISGGLMGEELIQKIKAVDSSLQIIVITKMTLNIADFNFASRLLASGAFWYCTKYPVDIEEYIYQPTDFLLSIFNAYEKRKLEKEEHSARGKFARTIDRLLQENRILGHSAPIQQVLHQVQKSAESNASVLISGPSGTGKELVARNIHYRSHRKFENFVPINCGSIPQDLVESELFGYEKGAFTGASAKKLGLFEVANRGTLFLDEIAELPPPAQVKLLRVLQEGEIEKIGRTDKISVDVRVIAATNKNLDALMEEHRFREDLFYRLNVVRIEVPPLREHREDIQEYVDHFLATLCADAHRPVPELDSEARAALHNSDWPGNVRELKNVLQRLLFASETVITGDAVESALAGRAKGAGSSEALILDLGNGQEILPWKQMEHSVREKYFRYVRAHSSSDADAAKKLGLAPPNYHRMCKELGIK
jgi:two-component system response regulator AtoC